jgi:hypothetical protein
VDLGVGELGESGGDAGAGEGLRTLAEDAEAALYAVLVLEVGGEPEDRVHAAVEGAVEVRDEPVDGLDVDRGAVLSVEAVVGLDFTGGDLAPLGEHGRFFLELHFALLVRDQVPSNSSCHDVPRLRFVRMPQFRY